MSDKDLPYLIQESSIFETIPPLAFERHNVEEGIRYKGSTTSSTGTTTSIQEVTIDSKDKVCHCGYDEDSMSTDSTSFASTLHISTDIHNQDQPSEVDDYSVMERSKLVPFEFKWSFGLNITIPILNLSTSERSEIFYSVANRAVIYDYHEHTMKNTHYHNNPIVAAAMGETGKWVVTSDVGKDSKIIFLDSIDCTIIRTIDSEYGDDGAIYLGLSPNGKYLVSIHTLDNNYLVKFWLWTFDDNEPNDTFECMGEEVIGKPRKIAFHPNEQEYIMIAFESQIIFFNWDDEEECMTNLTDVKVRKSEVPVTDCTLLENCHECYASTSAGNILIFGSSAFTENWNEHGLDNSKCYVKAIKISREPIVCLTSIDRMLVCVSTIGHIRFYDSMVRILYWHYNPSIPCINYVAFNLLPRKYGFNKSKKFSLKNHYFNSSFSMDYEGPKKLESEPEFIDESQCPRDASLNEFPIIIRNFIATTEGGNLYFMDVIKNICKPMFFSTSSPVASIDCYFERTYLAVSYEDESLSLLDYSELRLLLSDNTITLKRIVNHQTPIKASFLKYSPDSLNLAMGNSIGEIWFFNILMKPLPDSPYRFTHSQIMKLAFSQDSQFLACYDSSDLVFVIKYGEPRWILVGKIRPHCKKIRDLMLVGTPFKMFTISEDRHIAEYNVNNNDETLVLKSRISIDQSGVPQCFSYYPYGKNSDYFLVSNDQYKYKLIRESDKMCRSVSLGPSYGCFDKCPLTNMEILPHSNGKYMIFSNKTHIGIQMMPPDGNPFKYTGVMVNPNLKQFVVPQSADYVFTCGENDFCVMMWKINTMSVHMSDYMGGKELNPYYCLIEGGSTGWIFKEMQDLFCYVQILSQEDSYNEQKFGELLNITELPDLLRSCGYYPSEYEIQELFNHVKYKNLDKAEHLRDKITFIEFVILYINHRPAYGISIEELQSKFETLFEIDDVYHTVDSETFVEYLTTYGEPFTKEKADQCFEVLTSKSQSKSSETEPVFRYLPKEIDFEILKTDLLGILQETVYEETQATQLREEAAKSGVNEFEDDKVSRSSSI